MGSQIVDRSWDLVAAAYGVSLSRPNPTVSMREHSNPQLDPQIFNPTALYD
jgi:hypothetical protein